MKTRTIIPSAIVAMLFFSFVPAKRNALPGFAKRAAITQKNISEGNPYYIIISKKDYELKVYDDQGWYATYPCVFGSDDLRDKYMEGDKRTPDGKFKIILKKDNAQWSYEMLLDYPNQESEEKFRERKAEGVIPRNAKIGGGIAIHGTRPQEEWTVDYYQNWTDGCISLKYSEAKDLYGYIPVGTPVTIEE
ncbi:MAG TPA: L,D-transpeptidase [Chitinophagaceae bacterium]|nr:L,D-transpeptidase [Chitinophagaceae bacterium]